MGSRRKAFVSAGRRLHYTAAWMSDESPSCNVGLRFVHVNTLMYLRFRTMTWKLRIYVLSLESRETVTLIIQVVSMSGFSW